MSFPAVVNPNDPLDRVRVAFTAYIAKLVVDADGVVDFGELRLLSQVFPDPLLEELGFIDAEGGFTVTYRAAYAEAARLLPARLELEQKLELITIFHHTAMADGELVQAELLVLREAAELLGVPLSALAAHLDRLRPPRRA